MGSLVVLFIFIEFTCRTQKINSLILSSSRNARVPALKYDEVNLSGASGFEIAPGVTVGKLFLEGCRHFVIPKGWYHFIFLGNALDYMIMPGVRRWRIIGADPKLVRLAEEHGKQAENG